MNSPDIFRRAVIPSSVPGYDKVPPGIIVDLDPEISVFYNESANMREFEANPDEIMEEILMHICHEHFARDGLDALGEDIKYYHTRENGIEDGECLAAAATKLGHAMVDRFKTMGAYLPDGTLPFEMKGWLGDTTVILGKCLDYVP